MNRFVLLFILFVTHHFLYSQAIIQKTDTDYTLKIESDSIIRHLTFWKEKDSAGYYGFKYSYTKFTPLVQPIYLKNEIKTIEFLWNRATDSIQINLNTIFIGYPEEYHDILINHIQAFNSSAEWQNHLKKHGKKLDYKLIHKIMLDYNVYKPLNDFLLTRGYEISEYTTEKHGFITKETLIKAGFSGSEIIPMPFMVWISIKNKGCSNTETP
ncbi:MAG: hypothetical protein A2X13_00705 [Bacteroidetes bacterium GWC2_33_15]|nr:MAG: hypothetical protein A2X10_04515 [Bacteroidetes bacterium GWA2_33_15]OFX51139.1 MAG: hypothetical protein A2X13_00705 [Bacteroidetes bacterium GWC2_33_15]OFX66428.1 MAG: hypothetical protein A2X15_07250 [Bacteroidetes bacterium GWB2_32_14]OFX70347.1 MAG: hypothetical protein A2X14_03595 [Bacteroidetes bacterium GWD2_33_33]HAN17350.1 hypothetical protein [Bacteroidales bacterium]